MYILLKKYKYDFSFKKDYVYRKACNVVSEKTSTYTHFFNSIFNLLISTLEFVFVTCQTSMH